MTQQPSPKTKVFVLSIIALLAMAVMLTGIWSNQSSAYAAQPQSFSPNDRVDQLCSNRSLLGTYGFTTQGVTLQSSSVLLALRGPFASGGSATFNGQGNFTLTATSSFNGTIQGPTSVKGTYTVNADCTFDARADNGDTFRAVIVNGGNELLLMQTNQGFAVTGTAKKL
jgi:hypothetical protein